MDISDLGASRLLFGFTAAYHFLFVPLTIGLMTLIALLEGLALHSGRAIWRDAARFLGPSFLVNFACGVCTGHPLRAQIEQHWAGYAELVAPVFAAVFGLEGRIAPVMLGLVALFAFGWRMKPVLHWLVSSALALVLMLQSSAILMLNAWMQNPVGVEFVDGRAQVTSLWSLASNPFVVPKIAHTIGAAWVLGGMFVVAMSAWFLLRGRHLEMARGCLKLASLFTLAALALTGAAGHWSGERLAQHQPMKFAAIEALWETEAGSADLLLFALPDPAAQTNRHALAVPGLLGWIAGSPDRPLKGLRELTAETERRIRSELRTGLPAGAAMRQTGTPRLGHAALLGDTAGAPPSDAQIRDAARRAVPPVPALFWAFRAMLGAFALMFVLVLAVAWRTPDPAQPRGRRLLIACVAALPLPWIAIEAGWMVCEMGRQPWTVTGLLPTARSLGAVPAGAALGHLALAAAAGVLVLVLNLGWHLRHLRRGPRPLRARPAGAALAARLVSPLVALRSGWRVFRSASVASAATPPARIR